MSCFSALRRVHRQEYRTAFWIVLLVATFVIASAIFSASVEANDRAPQIPHDATGQESCLPCHSSDGPVATPPGHTAFAEGSCLGCHLSSAPLEEEDACLTCHSPSSPSPRLRVNSEVLAASVHGDKLLCTNCHSSDSTYHNAQRDIASLREYSVAQSEMCRQCHFENYTKTLDSIHYELLTAGRLDAPICTDCHGAHNAHSLSQQPAVVSQTCSNCHDTIYETYSASVHGKALIAEDSHDVPVCTDCHRSHRIEDPRTASFRLESVALCGSCHGDEKLMDKYGISTNVLKTYLLDFHGRTVSLINRQGGDIWAREAVCTDCHGVHDIARTDEPDSPAMKANLVATCQKCHPDATANFPAAWLSHYEPSIDKAPLVFFAKWFYRILIPFVLLGLSTHVLLDLWGARRNRHARG